MVVIANWKENLTFNEVKKWVSTFNNLLDNYKFIKTNVVVCPSYLYINYLKDNLKYVKVGAQDISQFESGAFTGEVSASQLKEFASYAIVGHSERRINFNEAESAVLEKVNRCLENNVIPMVCISSVEQFRLLKDISSIVVAYEPIENIGIGAPAKHEAIEKMVNKIKDLNQSLKIIYGGSVSENNVKDIASIDNLEGFLVGTDSLNANKFFDLCKTCDTLT